MIRFLFKLILCVLLALSAGFGYLAVRSGDPLYSVYEWISPARFQQYDKLIAAVAAQYHLDPMLVKAVVWRESRFDPQKYGTAGERGLMQVSEKAANEWARENKIDNFQAEELFDPKTNLEAGAWYLRRASIIGQISRNRSPSRSLNTMPAPAVRSDGPLEMRLPSFRRRIFFAMSIFPARANTSSRSSSATSFINAAAECERVDQGRADLESKVERLVGRIRDAGLNCLNVLRGRDDLVLSGGGRPRNPDQGLFSTW